MEKETLKIMTQKEHSNHHRIKVGQKYKYSFADRTPKKAKVLSIREMSDGKIKIKSRWGLFGPVFTDDLETFKRCINYSIVVKEYKEIV